VSQHRLNGLVIASELPLRPLQHCESPAEPDVRLRRVPAIAAAGRKILYVVPERAQPERPFLTVAQAEPGYVITAHGIGEFLIGDGVIDCAPRADCPLEAVEQILIDQILPRAMHLSGRPCFHASAAYLEGIGVVALVGESGAGKSTLCAALALRGHLVSDDSLALSIQDDRIDALPGYPSLRLWRAAAAAVTGDPSRLASVSPRSPKLRFTRELLAEPAPLAQFFVLRPEPRGEPKLDRLTGAEAFVELSRSIHRLVPDEPRALRAEFRVLGEVSSRVPCARLHYPRDFAALPRVIDSMVSWLTRRG
jgi:hypothetical protein